MSRLKIEKALRDNHTSDTIYAELVKVPLSSLINYAQDPTLPKVGLRKQLVNKVLQRAIETVQGRRDYESQPRSVAVANWWNIIRGKYE